MDLVSFLANSFCDLISDVANNVCYNNDKKIIVAEHLIKGLYEMHLQDYLPFLLVTDQNQKLTEVLKEEKKKPNGLHANLKTVLNVDYNLDHRDSVVD